MRFIVIDGIDGAGKSTMAKLLAKYLAKKNFKVFITHEPCKNTKIGKKIKELVRKNKKFSKEFWITLFNQDRIEHIENIIKPKLNMGYIVISDRYYYSTLAYQLNEKNWKKYLDRNKFLKPDLVFILDVYPSIGLNRIKRKKTIFEKEKFLEKVRKKFLLIYKKRKILDENIYLIDANQPKTKVFLDIKKIIDNFIK
ncbi:MAG: dTMP kinase [Candidatus Pacearchaeota archaeon]